MKVNSIIIIIFIAINLNAQIRIHGFKLDRVKDGDTFVAVNDYDDKWTIRLAWIDCPENGQQWSREASEYVEMALDTHYITFEVVDIDRYNRMVCRVYVDGYNLERGLLTSGLAWHYRRYSKDETLQLNENAAREAKRGIWSTPNPVAPWEYRKKK